MDDDAAAEVVVRRRGRLLRLTLDRPRAINALTLGMVRALARALDAAEHDERVGTVVIDGAGERGLCAGGDIRMLHDSAKAGDGRAATFWREEYALDARIASFPKPVVTLMDGIVMGGGVGLGSHASHRLVTERSSVGMPEVGIGFFPDVGGTWLLSRAPARLGHHLALTGAPVGAADAIHCGLADHLVASADLPAIVAALEEGRPDDVVGRYARAVPPAPLAGADAWSAWAYSAPTVGEVVERLSSLDDPVAGEAVAQIGPRSPTSLVVTHRAVAGAAALPTLEACLVVEYRVARRFLAVPDLVEGIRAAVVDKDRRPRWRPDRLDEVTDDAVAAFFEPLPDDLVLPPG